MEADKYPIVYVQWHDATSDDSTVDFAEAQDGTCHLIQTVGWLIHSDKSRVVLAMNRDNAAGKVFQYIAIPRSWCEVIHTLRKPS